MKRKILPFILVATAIFKFTSCSLFVRIDRTLYEKWSADTPLVEVLNSLGEDLPDHYLNNFTKDDIKRGYEIVHKGQTASPDKSVTARQSEFFVCTDCHITENEYPAGKTGNRDRFRYLYSKKMPFMPGTTLYGTVNRESWYNGDYYKKYGDAVKKARFDLRETVQLCATECSQGRPLVKWEMKAVLAYLWSRQLKLKDLGFGNEQIVKLKKLAADSEVREIKRILYSSYPVKAEATFGKIIPVSERMLGKKGNPEIGAYIFRKGCMYCHNPDGVTSLKFDDTELNHELLWSEMLKKRSIYKSVRVGTSPTREYRPYMPQYTIERLSDEHLEDLASYIRKRSGN